MLLPLSFLLSLDSTCSTREWSYESLSSCLSEAGKELENMIEEGKYASLLPPTTQHTTSLNPNGCPVRRKDGSNR